MAAPSHPRTWLLLGDKKGDNRQVEIIAGALGWPTELRSLVMLPQWVHGKPRVAPTLDYFDLEQSDDLEPPWPDMIITIGRRPSSAAMWVREQSQRQTKIILVGKPSGRIDPYDLVIVSGETHLPMLNNVMRTVLPLMQVDQQAIANAIEAWRPRLQNLPRPLIGILLGGPTGSFSYGDALVQHVIEASTEIINQHQGTPYISTSRRTPDEFLARLRQGLPAGAVLYDWSAAEPNPYQALLGDADGLLVAEDSISMMIEAVRNRRPLALLPIPSTLFGRLDDVRRRLLRMVFSGHAGPLAKFANATGIIRQTRDFKAFNAMLIEHGWASPYTVRPPFPANPYPDELAGVVERIHSIVDR